MIKRIEQWLARIFQTELAKATAEITALHAEVAAIKEHAENSAKNAETHVENVVDELFKDIKEHAAEIATDLHTKITADAKAILDFRQRTRMPCSNCGQMAWNYTVNREGGKTICSDCQKKGGQ